MKPIPTEAKLKELQLFSVMPGNSALLLPDTPHFTIIAATEGYLQTAGRSKDEVLGKGLFEAFPNTPDDPQKTSENELRSSLEFVLRKQEPHCLPMHRYDIVNTDGFFEERYWSAINKPVLGEGKEVIYIIHTAEDITEKQKAAQQEEKIKGIQKAYNLFMNAPVIIGILRGDDYIIDLANEGLLKVWGRTTEVIGKPLLKAIPELETQGILPLLEHVRSTGEPFYAYEFPIALNCNGKEEVLYFDFVYKPFYDDNNENKASGIISVGHDVTQQVVAKRKEQDSEAKYRGLFEAMDQGFCVLEMIFDEKNKPIDYLFLESNPVFEKQTGLKDAVGKTARELVPDLESDWFELYGRVAQTGRSIRFTEGSEAMGRFFDVYAFRLGDHESRKVALLFTDITERKKAEKAIKESESNLRNTILQAPVAMCILRGPSFVVEIANDGMYELWGRSKEELLGRSIFEGLPEVKSQGYEELLNNVFTTGERFTALGIPVTLPRSSGIETVYINLLYEPFREADGTISGVIAVATDATQQVLAQKRLEESEATLQKRVAERTADLEQQKHFIESILEASFNGIYALKAVRNPEGVITDFQYLFANRNIAKPLGREVGGVIGESMLTILPENKDNGFFDLFCRILQTGQSHQDETYFVAQNIDSWFNYVIVPIDEETLVVSTEDITERKQTALHMEEQRNLLENILKNSSNGISVSEMIRDENGQVIDALTVLANDAAVRYIGLPKDVYLSKRATEIEPAIIESPYYQQCIRTLETGKPFITQYFLESTSRWLELTVSRLDEDHLIHIFTDVTPIKEVQLQLERYVEDLKRSNQNLEEFAYAASHDLKEPMRKIGLFSNRLKDRLQEKLAEEDKRFFDRIVHATHRMNTLIDDLLLYSHVSRGAMLEEKVDLNQKVIVVLEDLEVEIEEKHASVTVDPLPTIKGHRRQLQQLFQNLISNALKYCRPEATPTVHISARRVKGNDATLPITSGNAKKHYHLIEVRDNGIGFNQEDAERIFHVFTRLHGNAEYKGTGVGLSIVRKVVENHGGYIWAESKAGEGATFKVLLPADEVSGQ